MRNATFPLIKLDDRAEDGRLIRSVTIHPSWFPLRVVRAPDDPLLDQYEAGWINEVVVTDGWVIGRGSLHDDLAMRIFGDDEDLYVEADTSVNDVETEIISFDNIHLDMHVNLTHATLGENPLWDGCEVTLG